MVAFGELLPQRAHLVGVAGAGMSGLARLLRGVGVAVTGSDAAVSPGLRALQDERFAVWDGCAPGRVPRGPGWVVRSAAVPGDDAEVRACAQRGLTPLLYAQAIGRLSAAMRTLAVAGAHGKTSTTALLAAALRGGGIDASYLVGGELPALGGNGHGGRSEWLAVEACEFNRSFHELRPAAAAVLNLDHDHFDCYPTAEALLASFAEFGNRVVAGGVLLVPADAPAPLTAGVSPDVEVWRVGVEPNADLRAEAVEQVDGRFAFEPRLHNRALPRLQLAVPGRFQVDNALFALGLALWAGADAGGAVDGIAGFRGVRRRFELRRGQQRGVEIIDDYAHHPTELAAVASAARQRFPGRRLLCAFQPHQHQRTAALLPQFAAALAQFDQTLITEIYAARETDAHRRLASAAGLAAAVCAAGGRSAAAGTVAELPARVAAEYRADDVVVILGAGDIEQAVEHVVARL